MIILTKILFTLSNTYFVEVQVYEFSVSTAIVSIKRLRIAERFQNRVSLLINKKYFSISFRFLYHGNTKYAL